MSDSIEQFLEGLNPSPHYEHQLVMMHQVDKRLAEGWEPTPNVPLIPHGASIKVFLRRKIIYPSDMSGAERR